MRSSNMRKSNIRRSNILERFMKNYVRGRALGIPLDGNLEATSSKLEALGFSGNRAVDVATAATNYALDETERLVRELTPRASWPGYVCIRRHLILRTEEAWLLLRYDKKDSWNLEAALIA